MTLEKAFKKYTDDTILKRPKHFFSFSVKWLKQLKAWANEESRWLGFIIPQTMIEDANAEDWELSNECTHDKLGKEK
jgi:hypothetical protein